MNLQNSTCSTMLQRITPMPWLKLGSGLRTLSQTSARHASQRFKNKVPENDEEDDAQLPEEEDEEEEEGGGDGERRPALQLPDNAVKGCWRNGEITRAVNANALNFGPSSKPMWGRCLQHRERLRKKKPEC